MNIRMIGPSAILFSVLLAGHARADEVETSRPTSSEATRLLSAFSKAYRPKAVEARVEAIGVLARYDHPKIAARLLKLMKRKGNDAAIQIVTKKGRMGEREPVHRDAAGRLAPGLAAFFEPMAQRSLSPPAP